MQDTTLRPLYITMKDAIKDTELRLVKAKKEFDLWATANPDLIITESEEYRQRRQQIKLLQLQARELNDKSSKYRHDILILPEKEDIPKRSRGDPSPDTIQSRVTDTLSYRNRVSNV